MRDRVLAEVTEYSDLLAAFRARAAERQIAIGSENAHAIAGLADRSIPKLLSLQTLKSLQSVRRVGMLTLGPLLGLLQIKLIVVEDPEAVRRFGSRLKKRNSKFVRAPRRKGMER